MVVPDCAVVNLANKEEGMGSNHHILYQFFSDEYAGRKNSNIICAYPTINFVLENNLDSMCILISQQVCSHSTMKHKNEMSDTISCL